MKIGVIGRITAEGKGPSCGQTIRTKILLDTLKKHYGEENIYLLNTGLIKQSKIKAVLSLLYCMLTCKDIILMVSWNGLQLFLPLLSKCQKYLGKRIYNNIIGSSILDLVEQHPKYPQYMSSFVVNWVQMKSLAEEFEKWGIFNVEVLPNSKPIHINSDLKSYRNDGILRFCTFSRISKAKGIELAASAIQSVNQEAGRTIACLDIYGVPDEDYKQDFEKFLQTVSDEISYKGLVAYDKSTEVLGNYFMLLFPTTYIGECFPGTIIDAYASGLPVLASDWKFNPELIVEGKTGYLYEHSSEMAFKEKIDYVIAHKEEVCSLRENCLKEAERYTPEKVMPIIFNKIDSMQDRKK